MSDLEIIREIILKGIKDDLIGLDANEKRIILETLKIDFDKLIENL